MRVTQKPESNIELKRINMKINNQNDPNAINLPQGQFEETKDQLICCQKSRNKLVKIRRDYLRKLQKKQQKCTHQINLVRKKYEQRQFDLTAKYQKILSQKQQYIQSLELMVNKGDSLNQTKKQREVQESKYVYTQHTKHYVPFYEQISDRIDFKLEPRMIEKKNSSVDTKSFYRQKRSIVQSCSVHQCAKSNSSSKHKLIPKPKPSESNLEPNIFQGLVNYKIHKTQDYRPRGLRPFLI